MQLKILNNYLIKKINKIYILIFIFIFFHFAPYPPISSTYDLRIVNRRFLSHILFEKIEDKLYLSIILTHGPNYHAFKSTSYRIYFLCQNVEDCLNEAIKLDEFLKTGYNIGFILDGDYIKKILYLNPDMEEIP